MARHGECSELRRQKTEYRRNDELHGCPLSSSEIEQTPSEEEASSWEKKPVLYDWEQLPADADISMPPNPCQALYLSVYTFRWRGERPPQKSGICPFEVTFSAGTFQPWCSNVIDSCGDSDALF